MDTNEIRALIPWNDPCAQCATHTIGHRLDAVIGAIRTIADALDELDERTRVPVVTTKSPEVRVDDPATCDCGICSEGRQGVSTIPGCYCRECKYYREDDELEGLGWCECSHPDAHATGIASREYGCVFGERKEAE